MLLDTTKTALTSILKCDPNMTPQRGKEIVRFACQDPAHAPNEKAIERIVRRREAAELLSVTPRCIDNWATSGLLHKVMLPGRTRAAGFRLSDVEALMTGEVQS